MESPWVPLGFPPRWETPPEPTPGPNPLLKFGWRWGPVGCSEQGDWRLNRTALGSGLPEGEAIPWRAPTRGNTYCLRLFHSVKRCSRTTRHAQHTMRKARL